jgi:hypothetical protein
MVVAELRRTPPRKLLLPSAARAVDRVRNGDDEVARPDGEAVYF